MLWLDPTGKKKDADAQFEPVPSTLIHPFMAESLLRFPSNSTDTDFQGHSPALLITSEHTCGDENSPRLEDNTHGHIPAQFESAMAAELDKEVRLTLLTLFSFSHPPSLPVFSDRLQLSDCSDSR